MIAFEDNGAFSLELADRINAIGGIGAIADDIAQHGNAISPGRPDMAEHSGQRFAVRMNIRDERGEHGSFLRAMRGGFANVHPAQGAVQWTFVSRNADAAKVAQCNEVLLA